MIKHVVGSIMVIIVLGLSPSMVEARGLDASVPNVLQTQFNSDDDRLSVYMVVGRSGGDVALMVTDRLTDSTNVLTIPAETFFGKSAMGSIEDSLRATLKDGGGPPGLEFIGADSDGNMYYALIGGNGDVIAVVVVRPNGDTEVL